LLCRSQPQSIHASRSNGRLAALRDFGFWIGKGRRESISRIDLPNLTFRIGINRVIEGAGMSAAMTTIVKMMESLPEDIQSQIAEHLREYIYELQEERQWDESFQRTQHNLVEAARRAKREIAEGKAEPLNYNQL
jgi:hypothetical protein